MNKNEMIYALIYDNKLMLQDMKVELIKQLLRWRKLSNCIIIQNPLITVIILSFLLWVIIVSANCQMYFILTISSVISLIIVLFKIESFKAPHERHELRRKLRHLQKKLDH